MQKNNITLNNLAIGYPGKVLFEDANVEFMQGELTALVGRNGTGKSSLMRTIMGLMRPMKGSINLNGISLSSLSIRRIASQISFVSTEEVKVSNLRVCDLVGLGRAPYTNWVGRLDDTDRSVILRSLELVGLSEFTLKGIDTLSDGERQRAMIARALAQDTPVILLDEPTAFLDLPNKYETVLLLHRLCKDEGKTILFSTHDLNIAIELCDKIVMINNGLFASGTPSKMIETGEIEKLFSGSSITFDRDKMAVRLFAEKKY